MQGNSSASGTCDEPDVARRFSQRGGCGARGSDAAGSNPSRATLRLRVGETEAELDLWQFVFHRKIARTAVYTSLVVGTLLTIINQGDIYVAHHVTGLVLLKTVLTYIVPYCVATFGALSVARVRPKDRVRKDGV